LGGLTNQRKQKHRTIGNVILLENDPLGNFCALNACG